MSEVRFLLNGDRALSVVFGNEITPAVNQKVRSFCLAAEKSDIAAIVELVPAYCSVMVCYDPAVMRINELIACLRTLLNQMDEMELLPALVLELPVLYGGAAGPDLEFVAKHAGMTADEVIALHTSPEYLIYMLGFAPGFAYLGGLNPAIATPRKETPRIKIPAGSVGIAANQTGVYPVDSPGGWQLIGRTPVKLYDPQREEPILLEAGQYIKFYSIDKEEYDQIKSMETRGGYSCGYHTRGEDIQ